MPFLLVSYLFYSSLL